MKTRRFTLLFLPFLIALIVIATIRAVDRPFLMPGTQPELANLQAAVLGHYAENDGFATPAGARELEAKIRQSL